MFKFLPALLALFALPALAADKTWDIDEVMGKPDAPITVIEYASLTCPHCAHFESEVFPKIKKDWIDTGKLKWVYRDYVWDGLAEAAAMISHCSGERYYTFLDTFFHSQQNWEHATNPLAALKTIAQIGGMSGDKVDACLADKALLGKILARKEDAEKLYGIHTTPSFLINGKLVTEVPPDYDAFVKLLK